MNRERVGWQLILPGDPLFDDTLSRAVPPNWQQTAGQYNDEFMFVARAGSGLLEPVSMNGVNQYLEEEYDERLAEIEAMDEFYS